MDHQMRKNRNALLVGAGHVGKRHALKLSKLFDKLYIIDPNQTALNWCKDNIKTKLQLFNDFENFNFDNKDDSKQCVAVISELGGKIIIHLFQHCK